MICTLDNGLKVIQSEEGFGFGIDAVLLSYFAKAKSKDRVVDLGTGNGIIPLLMANKGKGGSFTALEIQESSASMAEENVRLNSMEGLISVVKGDIKEAVKLFGHNYADVVVSNPPYFSSSEGEPNPNDALSISRHEVLCCLDDVVKNALGILKGNGTFFMIHRPSRLGDIFESVRKNRGEVKSLLMVYPKEGKDANLVLLEIKPFARPGLKVMGPLYVYNNKKTKEYSETMEQIRHNMIQ